MPTEHNINNLTIRENDDGTVDIIDAEAGEPKTINALSTDQLNSKVEDGSTVKAGHPDFASIQDAIDFGFNNGYYEVKIPPGDYHETITVRTDMRVIGSSPAGSSRARLAPSSGDPTVTMGSKAELKNLRIDTSSSTGTAVLTQDDLCRITDCRFGDNLNLTVDTNHVGTKIESCEMGATGDVLFGSSSSFCLIDSCTRLGSVTDNGSNNSPTGGNS